MIQIKFPPFSAKSVHPSVNLPATVGGAVTYIYKNYKNKTLDRKQITLVSVVTGIAVICLIILAGGIAEMFTPQADLPAETPKSAHSWPNLPFTIEERE